MSLQGLEKKNILMIKKSTLTPLFIAGVGGGEEGVF